MLKYLRAMRFWVVGGHLRDFTLSCDGYKFPTQSSSREIYCSYSTWGFQQHCNSVTYTINIFQTVSIACMKIHKHSLCT